MTPHFIYGILYLGIFETPYLNTRLSDLSRKQISRVQSVDQPYLMQIRATVQKFLEQI